MSTVHNFLHRLELLIERFPNQTAKELSEAVGINPAVIGGWRQREGFPSAERLIKFREKLNVHIDWLLTGKGPMYIDKSLESENIPELSLRALKIGKLYDDADDELRQIVDRVLAITPKPSGGKKK